MTKRVGFVVPVYRELLQVPGYTRNFESKVIGAFYKLLQSRIWRSDLEQSRDNGHLSRRVELLSKEYESGRLVANFTDEDAAYMLDISLVYLRTLRKRLKDLGLIGYFKNEYHSDEYYYHLGNWSGVIGDISYSEYLFIHEWIEQIKSTPQGQEPEFVQNLSKITDFRSTERKKQSKEFWNMERSKTVSASYVYRLKDQISSREELQESDKIEIENSPLNINKSNHKEINTNNSVQVSQLPLFEVHSEEISLRTLLGSLNLSTTQLRKQILLAVNSFGYDDTVKYLKNILLMSKPITNPNTKLSSIFEVWWEENKPNVSPTTLIWTWWTFLALDLKRPVLAGVVGANQTEKGKKTLAALSVIKKMQVESFGEFLYAVRKLRKKKEQNITGLQHIGWLYNLITQNNDLLVEYRNTYNATREQFRKIQDNVNNVVVEWGEPEELMCDKEISEYIEHLNLTDSKDIERFSLSRRHIMYQDWLREKKGINDEQELSRLSVERYGPFPLSND